VVSRRLAIGDWRSAIGERRTANGEHQPLACNSNKMSSIASAALSKGSTHVPAPR